MRGRRGAGYRRHVQRDKPRVRSAVLAVLVAAAGAGCAAAPPGTTLADLRASRPFYEGLDLGKTVTVTAPVAQVRGPHEIALAAPGGTTPVLTRAPVPAGVGVGTTVRVTGTVGQLHEDQRSAERVPYRQAPLYDEWTTHSYLYDATVTPTG